MKTILVIDDETEIRHNIVRTLELSDYNTISAENGVEGLRLAIEKKPDLIISDIMMPELDGFGVLKELQKDSSTSSIPFLFLSAKSAKLDIREAMNLGADDFLTKPFDLDDLLTAVEARLMKAERYQSTYDQKIEDLRSTLRMTIPHEIRTPLNIVLGLSEFLIKNFDKSHESDIKEMLQNINDSGKRLHRLFENYLFYANLEIISSNKLEVQKLNKKTISLVENIIKDIISFRANEHDRFEDIDFDLTDSNIMMSEYYFIKIIEEVIDNCFKFSDPKTKIRISSDIDSGYYFLSFTDFGRGMSSEQIKSIGAYVQFERKIYEQQGTGLGLAIVRKILELHRGELIIQSEVNSYTIVTMKIPLS